MQFVPVRTKSIPRIKELDPSREEKKGGHQDRLGGICRGVFDNEVKGRDEARQGQFDFNKQE
jgi:hypothetical protein